MNNQNKKNSMETKENSLQTLSYGSFAMSVPEDMSNEEIARMLEDAMREQAEEEKLKSELAYEVMMENAKEEYFRSQVEESIVYGPSELEALLKQLTAQKEIKTPDSDDLRDSQ